jgi:alpha-glucuronidase
MREDEDGYRLWLRYPPVDDTARLSLYRQAIEFVTVLGNSPVCDCITGELGIALPSLLGKEVPFQPGSSLGNSVVLGTVGEVRSAGIFLNEKDLAKAGDEGYLIRSVRDRVNNRTLITGNTETGVLHGMFAFLRLIQTNKSIDDIDILSAPGVKRRLLCHWENIDGSVERGYAGASLWKWDELPDTVDSRYRDYARACASVGINGSILNNPNARPESLSTTYLKKTAVLANVFRPWGIRVYLSAAFDTPVKLGGLSTADPRHPDVARWWREKIDEIYGLIPDFGGIQVKASSEGQSGPQQFGANHADGANMLADALSPHGGIVLWRAFVYDTSIDADRAKCAWKEFVPLDGTFHNGTFVQVKNGPVDFQPREPFHPLFGAVRKTPLAMEFQITQEYLGQDVHLVYLAPMWKEILGADTFASGEGSPVAKIIDGSLYGMTDTAIVGVANTGSEPNWCGHHFAQANWYAFGRLAWDYTLTSDEICEEWVRMTWSNDDTVVASLKAMMLGTWEACIDYMTPLGLHHLMQEGHHYGPDPGFHNAPREDWNNVYYHKADEAGLGFDRSRTGSNAVSQYFSPLKERFDALETCPEEYLLWFHHVSWQYRLRSGRNLIEELRYRYERGVSYVGQMRQVWNSLKGKIDGERYEHVRRKLASQEENACLWRDVCLKYFGTFVK